MIVDELDDERIAAQIAAENGPEPRPRIVAERPVEIEPRRRLHLQTGTILTLELGQSDLGQCLKDRRDLDRGFGGGKFVRDVERRHRGRLFNGLDGLFDRLFDGLNCRLGGGLNGLFSGLCRYGPGRRNGLGEIGKRISDDRPGLSFQWFSLGSGGHGLFGSGRFGGRLFHRRLFGLGGRCRRNDSLNGLGNGRERLGRDALRLLIFLGRRLAGSSLFRRNSTLHNKKPQS